MSLLMRARPFEITDALKKRFWGKVAVGNDADCWEWLASKRNGYGAIKIQRGTYQAHRVAFILTHGLPSDELVVGHRCDNKTCCNPSHLEAISVGQNNRDAKARIAIFQPVGTMCENAKLTEEIVAEIRRKHAAGLAGYKLLGKEYGIHFTRVRSIVKRRVWKHVS